MIILKFILLFSFTTVSCLYSEQKELSTYDVVDKINLLISKGKYKEAIIVGEEAIQKKNMKNEMVYFNLGVAYEENKNLKKAIEMYEEALQINKNISSAYLNSGNCYTELGNYEEALRLMKIARDMESPILRRSTSINIARVLALMGKEHEAEEELLGILKQEPNDIAALYSLGVLNKRGKNYPEAIKYFEKVLSLENNERARQEIEECKKSQ